EDAVLLLVRTCREVKRVCVAQRDAVAERQAPQAIDADRFAGLVSQVVLKRSTGQVEGGNGAAIDAVAEITDQQRAPEGAELPRRNGHAPRRGQTAGVGKFLD